MHPWHHYVALGDSFTEGVGDPVEGFAMLGATDRLADALRRSNPDLRYTNLAKRGLLAHEIREQQLEAALALKPDLVSAVAGANDLLTGRFSTTRWEEEFRALYGALTGIGAVVIAGTLPDFPLLRTLPGPLQTRVRGNFARGNAIIQQLAAEYRLVLVDAWAISQESAPDDWSADAVHLNARGYYRFSQDVIAALEQQTGYKL